MPYVAKHRIDAGEQIFEVGEQVPDEFADEAMVEAGSVEILTDKQFEALVDSDPRHKSNKELRELAADRGLDVNPRMNKDDLLALLDGDEPGASDADAVEE